MKCLRIGQLENKIGIKKSKIYELINLGQLPRPFKIGKSSVWIDEDIDLARLSLLKISELKNECRS